MKHPYFSILTPSWNRASYLPSVFKSLNEQNFKDFEWIIADDGSIDNTSEIVKSFGTKASFPIIYVRSSQHVGKTRIDNEAVKLASGNLTLWCDSDDYLDPNALHQLHESWQSIPEGEIQNFASLTALAKTSNGNTLASHIIDNCPRDIGWNELVVTQRLSTDLLYCIKTELLKACPFPEVDLYMPESVVWTSLGQQKTRVIPVALLIKSYNSTHAISFTGKMSYNRGRAYAMAIAARNLALFKRSFGTSLWQLITFIRCSIHGEIDILEARKLWPPIPNSNYYWIAFPIAKLLAIKDVLQRKVVYSHREFLESKDSARIFISTIKSI